jgi:hypothetical protein
MTETPTPSNAPTIEAARRFAALIRDEVLEEAARVCEALVYAKDHAGNEYRREATASQCAAAIRAAKEGA